jgi:hypothetical protein
VHVDVGTVRAWPRMTEAQLRTLFPKGRTLHMPTVGAILSASGRAWAQAQWDRCHAVPCSNAAALIGGAAARGKANMVQVAQTSMTGTTFADIHAGINPGDPRIRGPVGADDAGDDATGPAQMAVQSVAMIAPVPMPRPAGLEPLAGDASVDGQPATLAAAAHVPFDSLFPDAYAAGTGPVVTAPAGEAPVPAQKSYQMMVATGETPGAGRLGTAVTAIASAAPLPREPRAVAAPADRATVTAYAPIGRGTAAESQLEAIISSETTGTIAMAPAGGTALTNSMGSPMGAAALRQYAAARRTHQEAAPVLVASRSFKARAARLIAPGFDAALESPLAMTSDSFARFVEPAAMDLSPATELGPMVVRLGFHSDGPAPDSAHFAPGSSLLVAAPYLPATSSEPPGAKWALSGAGPSGRKPRRTTIGPSSVMGLRSIAAGSTKRAKLPEVMAAGDSSATSKPGAISRAVRALKLREATSAGAPSWCVRRAAAYWRSAAAPIGDPIELVSAVPPAGAMAMVPVVSPEMIASSWLSAAVPRPMGA